MVKAPAVDNPSASAGSPSRTSRETRLEELRARPRARVLVVGGGINGIATFRDLALQGVDVLLVEKADFCSQASAASSHMVHGGVRYLEYGEVRLVKEAVTERNRLLRTAPHYVRPLPTVIPVFKRFSGITREPMRIITGKPGKPVERGALVIKAGLVMYDALTHLTAKLPKHTFKGRTASLQEFPDINPDVLYTAKYYDASMADPERLAMELLLDGEAEGPHARALNYVSLAGHRDGKIVLRDEVSGEDILFEAEVVVNACGNHVDFANADLGVHTKYMGGTKGSHIVVDNPTLLEACKGNEMFFENHDGRIVLVFPVRDRVVIGTTDLRIDPGEHAVCTEEEIDYFIDLVKVVFPNIPVDRSQIVFQFSGVRPLPNAEGLDPGAVSRDHKIYVTELDQPRGTQLVSLVGGKWTTMRALGEQATDKVLELLGSKRMTDTKNLPIGGGRHYPATTADQQAYVTATSARTGVDPDRVHQLFARYGTRAAEFAEAISAGPDATLKFVDGYSRREIEHIAEVEQVVHLTDLLLRRSSMAFRGVLDEDAVREISGLMGEALGWDEKKVTDEAEAALHLLRAEHGFHHRQKPVTV